MLRRLALRDFVIVPTLELEFHAGFSVLTGETGAGKSILIDALQLALGNRADAGVVREGAARAEVSAEFDAPASLAGWLDEAGFAASAGADEASLLLLRRAVSQSARPLKHRAIVRSVRAAQIRRASWQDLRTCPEKLINSTVPLLKCSAPKGQAVTPNHSLN